jgi:SAM-dependent methyltransferase
MVQPRSLTKRSPKSAGTPPPHQRHSFHAAGFVPPSALRPIERLRPKLGRREPDGTERAAAGFFDTIVSFDAFQYFGTADLYLGYLVDFLKPGGRLGVVVPATTRELGEEIPAALAPFWEWDFCCWHTPQWWRTHWAKTRKVTVNHADHIEDGWRDWLQFNDAIAPDVEGWWVDEVAHTHDMLTVDQGTELGFARLVATKPIE